MCKYKKIIEKHMDAFYCEFKHDVDWLQASRICQECEHNAYKRTAPRILALPAQ